MRSREPPAITIDEGRPHHPLLFLMDDGAAALLGGGVAAAACALHCCWSRLPAAGDSADESATAREGGACLPVLAELEAALGAASCRTLRQGGREYDRARAVWNGDIDRRPALIAQPTTAAQVAALVRLCQERQLELTVRGGGHSVAGLAVMDGAVMLDLHRMDAVEMLAEQPGSSGGRLVRVEGGATWAQVDAVTAGVGAVPAGLISHTGVGGLALGGGVGWLARAHGLTCDNLREAEIVTAAGEVLKVRPIRQNSCNSRAACFSS